MNNKIITGNYYNKYESKNFIEIYLVKRYIKMLVKILQELQIQNCVEVGSGEGYILDILERELSINLIIGSDIDFHLLSNSKLGNKNKSRIICTAEELPISKRKVDLILACEVLEHLKKPQIFLSECQRIGSKYYLFSVPNEPLWRFLNILRFKYLQNLGNTPGHLNHWTKGQFSQLVNQFLSIEKVFLVQPWIFILAISKE